MKVILKQDVEKLGKAGEVVNVAAGYGRNYLIPKRLAAEATPGNIKAAETEKLSQARRDHREKESAALLAREIAKLTVTIRKKSGAEGSLYGSVTALDIAEFLSNRRIEIDKRKIQLEEPIKTIGEYEVPIRLHREVTVPVKVIVEPEPESAS